MEDVERRAAEMFMGVLNVGLVRLQYRTELAQRHGPSLASSDRHAMLSDPMGYRESARLFRLHLEPAWKADRQITVKEAHEYIQAINGPQAP